MLTLTSGAKKSPDIHKSTHIPMDMYPFLQVSSSPRTPLSLRRRTWLGTLRWQNVMDVFACQTSHPSKSSIIFEDAQGYNIFKSNIYILLLKQQKLNSN